MAKDFQMVHQVHKGHGRLDKHPLTTSCLLNDYAEWPCLAQVFTVEQRRTQTSDGTTSYKVVYGLISLTRQEANAQGLRELTRDYWDIEKGLHDCRDRTLREDDTRITNAGCAEVIALLNHLVISMIRRTGWTYLPEARRHYEAHLDAALCLVLEHPT